MTAYVVYGMGETKAADVVVDASMLQRGADFLTACLTQPSGLSRYPAHRNDANVRAWMLYALSSLGDHRLSSQDARRAVDMTFDQRDELSDYGRAMLALVLHDGGDAARAGLVVANLENTVQRDAKTGTASWGHAREYYRWYDGGVESTAMVLRALLAIAPKHQDIARSVNWLVRQREGSRWYSTKDTALAVYALSEYLAASGELDADMTVTIAYDADVRRTFRINGENVLSFDARLVFAAKHLTPGPHTLKVHKNGRGHVYYASYVDYYTKEDPIAASGHDVHVTRAYARLLPKEVQRTRTVWDPQTGKRIDEPYMAIDYDGVAISEGDAVESGDLIEVQLQLDARNNFEYIMIEDPKPAGCEPVELRSGSDYGSGLNTHTEMRDKHVAFFADYVPQGVHTLTYRLR